MAAAGPSHPRVQAGRPPTYPRPPQAGQRHGLLAASRLRLAAVAHELPPWQTVYHYFRSWRQQELWGQIHRVLYVQERTRQGRRPTPSVAILDSQSVKTTERGGQHGYDGAKRVNGRKRHLLVDTLGLVCKVEVTAADVGDRDGAVALLRRLDRRRFPRLRHG